MDIEVAKTLLNYGALGVFAVIFFKYINKMITKQDDMSQQMFENQNTMNVRLIELMTLLKDNLINAKFSNRQLKYVLNYKYLNISSELFSKMSEYIFRNNIIRNYDIINREMIAYIENSLNTYRNELEPLIEETKFKILYEDLEKEIYRNINECMKVFNSLKKNPTHTKEELDFANREVKTHCNDMKNNLLMSIKKVC